MAGLKKPLVVITRKLPDQVETRMRELFDAQLNLDDRPMSREELAAAVKQADVLVPTITDRIDAAVNSENPVTVDKVSGYVGAAQASPKATMVISPAKPLDLFNTG